ncbi:hypothetical protein D3C71_1505940 [compost metagenome]
MEIQGATGAVPELLVEGLAGDFLGRRVGRLLLYLIRTPVTPPRKLAGPGLDTLLDHSAHRIGETLMTQAVHHHIGDPFHIGRTNPFGLPVNGP